MIIVMGFSLLKLGDAWITFSYYKVLIYHAAANHARVFWSINWVSIFDGWNFDLQYVSLVFIGMLITMSVRGFLQNLTKVDRILLFNEVNIVIFIFLYIDIFAYSPFTSYLEEEVALRQV